MLRLLTASALLVASGCATGPAPERNLREAAERFNRLLDRTIGDDARSEAAQGVVREIEAEVHRYRGQLRDVGEDLARINLDYEATREDFDGIYDELDAARQTTSTRLIELLADLRGEMIPTEWDNVMGWEGAWHGDILLETVTVLMLFFGEDAAGDGMERLVQASPGSVIAVTDRLQMVVAEYRRKRTLQSRKIEFLDEDYEATADDYLWVMRETNFVWRDLERRLVDLRFEMRELMTPQTWETLFLGVSLQDVDVPLAAEVLEDPGPDRDADLSEVGLPQEQHVDP